MKYLILTLLAISQLSFAAPYSTRMMSRNSLDNGNVTQDIGPPPSAGVIGYDIPNNAPFWVTLGSGLAFTGSVLDVTATPVNADWNSSTGLSQILNKPSIPAAQVNSDWNASSVVAQILNKPTIPTITPPSQSSATRALNTAFQISTTRPALVVYSVQITVTASIAGGQNGDVILEIASDSGFTTNVQTLSIAGNGQTYTLAVALQGVQPTTNIVSGFVPAGYYARLRTVNNAGTPAFTYRAGQEVQM